MFKASRLILFVALLLASSLCCAAPSVVDTIFPTDDIVIANAIVDAPRDGSADASAAIQSAIDRVAAEGGGVVFVPAGRYRLDARLIVRKSVTLRGDWAPPTSKGWQQGTILIPTADRGHADALAAISLMCNSGVRNMAFWYPDQSPTHPVAYPWTISTTKVTNDTNVNDAQTVMNVTLVNSYKGVTIGPDYNFLHVLRNIYGTPLKTGLSVDRCFDIGRTQNVDFRADWWENSGLSGAPASKAERSALRGFLLREGTALDLGRDEWGYLYDVRVKGYATGIVIRPGFGNMNGVIFGSRILDCGTALRLDDVSQFGIGVTGCSFSGRDYAVYAPKSFVGVMQFNSCSFASQGKSAVRSEGSGTMTFMNCDLKTWRDTALDATAGSISVMGCRFGRAGGDIALGKDVKRAIILSNRFTGKPSIANHAQRIDLRISHRPIDFAKPDVSLMPPAPDRRPATRKLFVVTDFGASTTAEDNTASFERAFQAASQAGGGTVYVPAGAYRFKGEITVPTGVELRGCYDIEHHTNGAGSAVLPTTGRGDANGTPFIRLQPGSGLRGLTVWYPDQDPGHIVAYPWAVQGLGPGCWVINLNCGNAYQGVDLWTYPSDGHVVKYLSGAYYRKGLWISKCKGDGWVDDLHFNPHYSAWVDPILKPIALPDWTPLMNYVRSNLDGIVFGRCEREHIKGTFLYAAHDGLAFRDDNGGTNARVIHHGTDTGSRCVAIEASGAKGIELIDTQLTPYGPEVKAGIVVGDSFAGKTSFFNTMMWVPDVPAVDIAGKGDVLIQQFLDLSGVISLRGGRSILDNIDITTDRAPQVLVDRGCASARVIGGISASGVLRIENRAGRRCYARANSLSVPPAGFVGIPEFRTGWEEGDTLGHVANGPLAPAADMYSGVSSVTCSMTDADSHSGKRSLRISGSSNDPQHGYAYFRVVDGPIAVYPDTVLSYWMKPGNPRSTSAGIDLEFVGGGDLRSSGINAASGEGVHPANTKGAVGQWSRMVIPLGRYFAGRTISAVMFAYDGLPGTGPFEALFDDLTIESKLWTVPWKVTATPLAGTYAVPVRVSLKAPGAHAIRYTLDGTPPGPNSPIYTKPILLDTPGLWDVRYTSQSADGSLSWCTFGQLYDVAGGK